MDQQFKHKDRPIATELRLYKVSNIEQAINCIKLLPYGRNLHRSGYLDILQEQKGTCSSKHAFIKSLIDEQEILGWDLILSLYRMNSRNTPKVKEVLDHYNIDYIPEAHTYLKCGEHRFDLTFADSSFEKIKDDILLELAIEPSMIVDFKVDYHKNYLHDWLLNEKLNFTFDEIWSIREQCILKLSE